MLGFSICGNLSVDKGVIVIGLMLCTGFIGKINVFHLNLLLKMLKLLDILVVRRY